MTFSNVEFNRVLAVAIGKCVGFYTVADKIYKSHQVTRKSLTPYMSKASRLTWNIRRGRIDHVLDHSRVLHGGSMRMSTYTSSPLSRMVTRVRTRVDEIRHFAPQYSP